TIDAGMRFRSPAGAVLEEGDEFVSDGARWSISYLEVISVTYLGPAPIDPAPIDPELADTGPADPRALIVLAGLLTLIGAAFTIRRRTA
ncbi:MAG: LPXTG cell wall anchor domain-containing protein, partial [Microcella sp.]|nr:LPXTG cell wall anchor domain-containing protein [Microcella sp.]